MKTGSSVPTGLGMDETWRETESAQSSIHSVPTMLLISILLFTLTALFTKVKNPPANAGDTGDKGSIPGLGRSPGEMAAHSSSLAWKIPWTEEPGDYSPWSRRVRHS